MSIKKNSEVIVIPALRLKDITLRVIGDSPFICHAWSEKAKLMMLNKQQKKATAGKEIRRPAVEFADSLYWLTEKPSLGGLTDEEAQKVLSEIIPKSRFGFPTPREDIGRIGKGTADLRYRAEFKTWYTELNIQYNSGAVSAEQITNIFNVGGFACGIGDWRPAKDGAFGTFHIE